MKSITELWSKDNLSNYRDILVKSGPLAFYVQFVQDYVSNNGIELVEPKSTVTRNKINWHYDRR